MDYINEFDIHLDKEMYYPGELLTGKIWLKTIENFKLKSIKVLLRGKAHCEWKMMIQNEKRTVKDEEIFIDDRALIYGTEKSDQYVPILPRGSHLFNLQFQLPESQLPCSFESKFCTIRYYVKVTLEIPYASSPQGIKYFTLIGPYINCMDSKNLKPLVSNKTDKICCFCTTTYLTQLKVNLERSAYCSGEMIRVKAFIHNKSSSSCRLRIKLIQYFNCSINRGVIGLNKQSSNVVLEYRGDEIAENSRSKFDSANSLVIPVVPPTVDSNVCRLMNISYVLKVWIEGDKSNEILKVNFPILIATSPFRIPNSTTNLPVIEYETCCEHVEGGNYIGPEFQLGQVYDGSCNSHEEVVLYRPVYVCVKSRRKDLKELHSKESKESTNTTSKETNPKELHKHSSLNKESSKEISNGNEQQQISNEQLTSSKRKPKKQQSLKNQHSFDSIDRSITESGKRSSLVYQMSFNKLKLSSLDEQQTYDEFNLLENNNLIEENNLNQSVGVISTQPRSSIH